MHNLSDKFVIDQKSVIQHNSDEARRVRDAKFTGQERQIKGHVEMHEHTALNPMSELLKGIKV